MDVKRFGIAVAMLAAGVAANAQDDPLSTARDLYVSAAYEEALSELTRVGSSAPTAAAAREMDAYRAFCLVALGRTAEAETMRNRSSARIRCAHSINIATRRRGSQPCSPRCEHACCRS
jgi:hypothetical protein